MSPATAAAERGEERRLEVPTRLLLEARDRNPTLAALDLERELERLEHEWVGFNGLRIHLERHDVDPGAPTFIVVHGLGDHSRRQLALATALAERGFNSLLVDRQGHGLSEGRRGDSPLEADLGLLELAIGLVRSRSDRPRDPARRLARRDHELVPAHPRARRRRRGLPLHRPSRRPPGPVLRPQGAADGRRRAAAPVPADPGPPDRRLRARRARPRDQAPVRSAARPAVQLHGQRPLGGELHRLSPADPLGAGRDPGPGGDRGRRPDGQPRVHAPLARARPPAAGRVPRGSRAPGTSSSSTTSARRSTRWSSGSRRT